jgi:hypothetical protein
MEAFKRTCPICGDPAELSMPMHRGGAPSVAYECKGCGRRFTLLPSNARKALFAAAVLFALVMAGGLVGVTMSMGLWGVASEGLGARREFGSVRLFVVGAIGAISLGIALARDTMRRRASPVLSRT